MSAKVNAFMHQGIWDDELYSVRRDVTFAEPFPQAPFDDYYQAAFRQHIDNREIIVQYRAKTSEEIRTESLPRQRRFASEENDRHVVGLPDASLRRQAAVAT